MILTDTAFDVLIERRDTFVAWLLSIAGLQYSGPSPAYQQPASSRTATPPGTGSHYQPGGDVAHSAEAHHGEPALTPREQKARVVALRGLSQTRDGEYDAARETFANALRLDPGLDLSRLPSFWKLPGQTHEAVIDALYDTGRPRDAASLIADLRTRFRPRLLPNRQSR